LDRSGLPESGLHCWSQNFRMPRPGWCEKDAAPAFLSRPRRSWSTPTCIVLLRGGPRK
jgi:hypothetical protein